MLQEADKRAWSTEDLTKSFGWNNAEGQQQQDIQELNRILVEALETALKGTVYESLMDEMFFGESISYITCGCCGHQRSVNEKFLDLPIQVQNLKGVAESLEAYFTPDEIEGFNCEACEKPQMHTKGPLLSKLPPVLTFNLQRITYDMTTWDRIKINDKFEYPLELDMSKYLAPTDAA